MPNGVCLVVIGLVVVDVWVGVYLVSGFLVPSHYLVSGISTSTLTCFYLPLLLPLVLLPLPLVTGHVLWVGCKFLAVWVVKCWGACYTSSNKLVDLTGYLTYIFCFD